MKTRIKRHIIEANKTLNPNMIESILQECEKNNIPENQLEIIEDIAQTLHANMFSDDYNSLLIAFTYGYRYAVIEENTANKTYKITNSEQKMIIEILIGFDKLFSVMLDRINGEELNFPPLTFDIIKCRKELTYLKTIFEGVNI